ncbi:DUF6265 family protein [Massilia cavernae]|uniref:DUF6265 domain-containing protein n=1 Tax=Massilia cavernae TaxID=2320864 RepID=A0A418XRJ1_9BURK|nr:DUF6265 family protein [Massilia cavernae]RJG15125.1 hypothetical protein D3872_14695 [Massilia cavernae]
MNTRLFHRMSLCAALVAATGTALAANETAAQFGWLQGCWQATGGEPGSGETWTSAAGGTLLGLSRTVKGGRTVAHEFVQIRETEPGKLAYIALPSGQAQATFPLAHASDKRVVFENLAHDFPKRIIYRREGSRLLFARVEGEIKGKLKGIDFPMERTSCDPG